MVGPTFKTMKSEFVACQEAISAKKYDLHNEKKHDQPEGDFMKWNMNRSQQNWVKTFMQDAMNEKGQVLFDNLTWLVKKLCSVMTSASACEHMWIIEGCIHNKRRNRLVQPNIERTVCDHVNLVLRKTILLSKELKVSWDLQTLICEPHRLSDVEWVLIDASKQLVWSTGIGRNIPICNCHVPGSSVLGSSRSSAYKDFCVQTSTSRLSEPTPLTVYRDVP